jgi:hypothetical protein
LQITLKNEGQRLKEKTSCWTTCHDDESPASTEQCFRLQSELDSANGGQSTWIVDVRRPIDSAFLAVVRLLLHSTFCSLLHWWLAGCLWWPAVCSHWMQRLNRYAQTTWHRYVAGFAVSCSRGHYDQAFIHSWQLTESTSIRPITLCLLMSMTSALPTVMMRLMHTY